MTEEEYKNGNERFNKAIFYKRSENQANDVLTFLKDKDEIKLKWKGENWCVVLAETVELEMSEKMNDLVGAFINGLIAYTEKYKEWAIEKFKEL